MNPHLLKNLPVLALLIFCTAVQGKAQPDLSGYLKTHCYPIALQDTNAFSMLPALMGRQNVLISGEGASHDLYLYDTLQLALRRQLIRQNLKVVLIEFGHDLGFLYNRFLDGEEGLARKFAPSALLPYQPFVGTAKFRVAGIDFERAGPFHLAVSTLLRGLDTAQLKRSSGFIRMISDSSVASYSEKEFNRFYKRVSAAFIMNETDLRADLGDRFQDLKYLCTNPNTTQRYEYRDPAMAKNLLSEIAPFDTTATYYCEIGNAHSKTDNRGSMAALLSMDPVLSGRIIVMNTYCENCRTEEGPTKNAHNKLGFMKGARLEAFRNAAVAGITLFDLSGLEGANAEIRKSGDLLLFVRNHD